MLFGSITNESVTNCLSTTDVCVWERSWLDFIDVIEFGGCGTDWMLVELIICFGMLI